MSLLVNPRRKFSDAQILREIAKAFKDYGIRDLSIDALQDVPSSFRPYNETNLSRIASDIHQNGFHRTEPLIVWHVGKTYAVIGGHQLFLAAELEGLHRICCLVIHGMDHATTADLLFGSVEVSTYESRSSPRSPMSRVIELRTMIDTMRKEGIALSSMDVHRFISRFPPPHPEIADSPYVRHWSHAVGVDSIRKFVFCAKTFYAAHLSRICDDVERVCFDPASQISADMLIRIAKAESLRSGFGKRIMERICKAMEQNSKHKVLLTTEEKEELRFLESDRGGPSGGPSRMHLGSGSQNPSAVHEKQALKKLEAGIKLLKACVRILGREQASEVKACVARLEDERNRLANITKNRN